MKKGMPVLKKARFERVEVSTEAIVPTAFFFSSILGIPIAKCDHENTC